MWPERAQTNAGLRSYHGQKRGSLATARHFQGRWTLFLRKTKSRLLSLSIEQWERSARESASEASGYFPVRHKRKEPRYINLPHPDCGVSPILPLKTSSLSTKTSIPMSPKRTVHGPSPLELSDQPSRSRNISNMDLATITKCSDDEKSGHLAFSHFGPQLTIETEQPNEVDEVHKPASRPLSPEPDPRKAIEHGSTLLYASRGIVDLPLPPCTSQLLLLYHLFGPLKTML